MTEPVENKNWWFSNILKTMDIYHNQFFEIWRVAVMNPENSLVNISVGWFLGFRRNLWFWFLNFSRDSVQFGFFSKNEMWFLIQVRQIWFQFFYLFSS